MKNLFCALCLTPLLSYSQWDCTFSINFGFADDLEQLFIDTISNPTNIWQIGPPQKSVFTSALGPEAIVTDTLNTYPVNDTSSFLIKHVACDGFSGDGIPELMADYYVHTDSLNDFGKIELSPDNGITWVLISDDTTIYNSAPWPTYINQGTLTGSSNGWEGFGILLYNMSELFNVVNGDTVLFRFTFISDGISESMDGLMFDNIQIVDEIVWGIEVSESKNFFAFPNPVDNYFDLSIPEIAEDNFELKIYNILGEEVLFNQINHHQNINIDCSNMKSGVYYFKLISLTGEQIGSGQFVKL